MIQRVGDIPHPQIARKMFFYQKVPSLSRLKSVSCFFISPFRHLHASFFGCEFDIHFLPNKLILASIACFATKKYLSPLVMRLKFLPILRITAISHLGHFGGFVDHFRVTALLYWRTRSRGFQSLSVSCACGF